jgi:tetratricopeptide (TPR) repeat protein
MRSLLLLLLLAAATGCAKKIPVASSSPGKLSVENARATIERALRMTYPELQSVTFRTSQIVVATSSGTGRAPLAGQIYQYRCSALDGCDVWVSAEWTDKNGARLPSQSLHFWTRGGDPENMRPIVDAYNELVARNLWPHLLNDGFDEKAAAWIAANPKPPLSEAANRHRILAENAFREKDTARATEHFQAALATDPTWPDGNFNLALLLGEAAEYREAARYMKRYLLLVPDSKDAKAAQEKIVVWEDKAARETP